MTPELPAVLRSVTVTVQGVLLQVCHGPEGMMYNWMLSWAEMEELTRRKGVVVPFGQMPGNVSGGLRQMMERDPEGPT